MTETTRAAGQPGRVVLPITGTVQYLELELDAGVRVSVHASAAEPGRLWVTGLDRRRDYRPLKLDREQAAKLRDALDLALEELPNPTPPPLIGA